MNRRLLATVLTLITICLVTTKMKASHIDLEKAFNALDTVVAHRADYVTDKLNKIEVYKRLHSSNIDGEEMFSYCKYLLDEYLKFDTDSALHYAELSLQVADSSGYATRALLAKLDIGFITLVRGQMLEVFQMLQEWGPIENYPRDVQIRFSTLKMEFAMRYHLMEPMVRDVTCADSSLVDVWDKYGRYLPKKSWMEGYYRAMLTYTTTVDELERLINASPQPSIPRAMLCFALGKIYSYQGDQEMATYYYILSAINDVKTANSDVSSLVYLLHSPYLDNSSERAVNYAAISADNVTRISDSRRSKDVLSAYADIAKAYEAKRQINDKIQIGFIVILSLLLLVVLCLIYFLVRKRRQLEAKNKELASVALMTEKKFAEESDTLRKMMESNESMRHYIDERNKNFIDVFAMASHLIEEMRLGRKAVYNMLTAGNVAKARDEMASSRSVEVRVEEFHKVFDRTFLAVHPDFIERFNTLLRPQHHFALSETELTPELRIYALVSVGITDSVSIAEFLHYSPQTVYNYRMRMRRRSCIDEKTFAKTVAGFYGRDST